MWDHSKSVHYWPDMANAWRWGSEAAKEGYFSLYDRVVARRPDGNYELDYVPLRLAVMTVWARERIAAEPAARGWRSDYDFNATLLRFNTAMELAAAAGVFALAWPWVRRTSDVDADVRPIDLHLRSAWLAVLPAALAWLNPASIVSAHARPTWDVWVTPFYVWAIYCACVNRWFLGGLIIAIGAMLKGQQLIVAPVFILWPLMGVRFRLWRAGRTEQAAEGSEPVAPVAPAPWVRSLSAAGRWVLGFAFGYTLIASPWLVPQTNGSFLTLGFAILFWPLIWLALRIRRDRFPRTAAWIPATSLRWSVPATLTLAIWLCFQMFGGSLAWAKVGLVYGADKFQSLEVGGASTLASILQNSYGWQATDHAVTLPWVGDLTVEGLLSSIFTLLLVVAAWGLHATERRRDRKFLLVAALPWLAFFAVAPRMHERYLLWGAIVACLAAANRPGPTLLAVFFSLASTTMSLFQIVGGGDASKFLTEVSPTFGRSLLNFTRGTHPGLGWGILLATATWLYLCIVPAKLPRWRFRKRGTVRQSEDRSSDGLPIAPPTGLS